MPGIKEFVRRLSFRKKKPKKSASSEQQQQQHPVTNGNENAAVVTEEIPHNRVENGSVTPDFQFMPPQRAGQPSATPQSLRDTTMNGDYNPPNVPYLNGAPEYEYERIKLVKPEGKGLGFTIAGGTDNAQVGDDPSVFVTKIIDGGTAANNGRLRLNDIIVSVNKKKFTNLTHAEAVGILKTAVNPVVLKVKRPKAPLEDIYEIDLTKAGKGLGFTVSGGVDQPYLNGDQGIFITKLTDSGSAQRDGRLRVGDRLLSIDDQNMDNLSHEEAVSILKSTGQKVAIVVGRPRTEAEQELERRDSSASSSHQEFPAPPPPAQTNPAKTEGKKSKRKKSQELPQLVPTVLENADDMRGYVREPRKIVLAKPKEGGLGFYIYGGKNGEGIFVSTIVPGGVADQNGDLRKGDQILSVNGVNLSSASHQEALATLKSVKDFATIVVQYRPEEYNFLEKKSRDAKQAQHHQQQHQQQQHHYLMTDNCIRALFTYDPLKDVELPGLGLAFQFGDILLVEDQRDEEWWTARIILPDGAGTSGFIPSKQRVERRERNRLRNVKFLMKSAEVKEVVPKEKKRRSFILSKKLPFMKSKDRLPSDNSTQPQADEIDEPVLSYETVKQVEVNYCRPVVIMGPMKERINEELITELPAKFNSCVPHTTRPKRADEVDGQEYYFVKSREQMERDVERGLFIEAGVYQGQLYGLSSQAVKNVAVAGKHCLLDVSGPALKCLQMANLQPIAILIQPPDSGIATAWMSDMSDDMIKKAVQTATNLLRQYGKYFTAIVSGDTVSEIYVQVKNVILNHSQSRIWVSSCE